MLCTTQRVASVIRRYCSAHPQARDSIEGIGWWVQLQLQEELKDHVAAAVELLTQEGTLERHRLQDGTEVFGCKAHPTVRDAGDESE